MIDRRSLILGLGAAALAGCEGLDPTVGTRVSDPGFSTATAHNLALMRGQIDVTEALSERFAAEVPTTVNFEFGSAALDSEAREIIARQAEWIRQFPEVRFTVIGHTDLVGSERFNQSLGLRRANAVVHAIQRAGVGRGRLQAVVSRGQREPLIATPLPERQNRRAETRVSGFVRRHPTVMSGQYAQIIHREFIESATAPVR